MQVGGLCSPLGRQAVQQEQQGWGSHVIKRLSDDLRQEFPIAAATAAVIGIPQAAGHRTLGILAAAAGLAILMPVLPFTLEMLALRMMTPTAFGTLMALEPALGVLLGLLILHQQPSAIQVLGILLVVLAGAAAQRGGRRSATQEKSPTPADLDLVG